MLQSLLLQSGFELSQQQGQLFEKFLVLFQEKNKEINLSAIRENKDIIIKHFIDSLMITKREEYKNASRIIDIGTGGGFPGIPLAIFSREKQFLLVDSVEKKINMINFFIQSLGLKNATSMTERSEKLGQNEQHREQYDLCVSRAVAYFPTLLEYCLPFVKIGGYFIAYKEENEEEFLAGKNALNILGGTVVNRQTYSLPTINTKRYLISIKKIRKTPAQYPREVGAPKKKPL